MKPNALTRLVSLVALTLVLAPGFGCKSKEPTRWDEIQKQSSQTKKSVAPEAVKGAALNTFFPKQEAPYDIVFKQEKPGFVMANVKKDKKDVAGLSISDIRSDAKMEEKYATSTAKIGEYPAAAVGSMGTAVKVGSYQVQVRSLNPSFSKEDREAWIQKFDLAGLEKMK